MNIERSLPLKIGIVGAGFSGTAAAAALHRLIDFSCEIFLFEKSGCFGTGDAYSTPFSFHLLNARARDMSAFEDQPGHFVEWVNATQKINTHVDKNASIGEQFLPRFLYGEYLHSLLQTIQQDSKKVKLHLEPTAIMDIIPTENHAVLKLQDEREISVDVVILALGNGSPAPFPFAVTETKSIHNPWDYNAPKQIAADDPVLIVGTGLSMIDAVLTLHHQQHQGKIYAVSRHGLLPLPHADIKVPFFSLREHMPTSLRSLTQYLRMKSASHAEEGGDWRSVINAVRTYIPALWIDASLVDKKRFLRHLLPYWNIHRHRVHAKVAELLAELSAQQQLTILSGRIQQVENGLAKIKLRGTHEIAQIKVKWVVNCMGPALAMDVTQQPLVQALTKRGIAKLDVLNLGFDVTSSGELTGISNPSSAKFYTLGSFRKGASWEAVAVPEIRKQCFDLVQHLAAVTK